MTLLLLLLLLLVAAALVGIGYAVQRRAKRTPRAALWAILLFGAVAVERLLSDGAPLVRMAGMSVWLFLLFKTLVAEEERREGMRPLSFARWFAFAVLWIGMRPRLFASPARQPVPGVRRLVLEGATRLAAGLGLLVLARAMPSRVAPAVLGAGLLLAFHFGAFTMLAAAWRARGVRCEPLVREPTRSRSLTEFWSRRWNLAYSETCTIVLYRPLAPMVGRGPAVLASFLFSGVLHEIAVSLPVKGGYGLPTLYFAVHGVLVLGEHALARRGRPVRALAGRIWTLFWIFAPMPLLFHRPFVAGVLSSP